MKTKIIVAIYALLAIVCLKLGFIYIYNEYIISEYNDDNYSINTTPLTIANYPQPYLVHYNQGNIHYQNKEYLAAITEYETALEKNPIKDSECDVRINLALAILKTATEDYANPENIEESIEILNKARNVLLEDGCATEKGDGHNETAEKLKQEIDEILRTLQDMQTTKPEDDNNKPVDQEKPKEDKDDKDYEQNIKEQLEQQQNDSYKERGDELKFYEEFNKEFNFDLDGKVW